MTIAPELELEDIRSVTNDVWVSFLATYGDLEWAAEPLDDPEVVHASVAIRGDWTGTVSLEMSPTTAVTATRTMLHIPDGDPVEELDVSDALGELVNMIGGNIKSLLPPGSSLGLPKVMHAPHLPVPAGVEVTEHYRVELAWAGTPIRIRVWSGDEK